VGTCFEYGPQFGPIDANIETHPNNPYGFAKDVLHKQLQQLKGLHPFKLTWARLFYMYGLGQAESSLYSLLRSAVERGDKVFKMSGGEQLRDYLPVEDVASAIVDLAFEEEDKCVVNICSGQPISIRRLVEGWIQQNGWDIELALGEYPYPDYEPLAFWGLK
jgi:dTDP-6-deoxy-L-talose 4-dehydrogenase (NAD+)